MFEQAQRHDRQREKATMSMTATMQEGRVPGLLQLQEEQRRAMAQRLQEGARVTFSDDRSTPIGDGDLRLAIVDGRSPAPYQRLAHELARLAKSEIGSAAPAWGLSESEGRSDPHAFVLLKNGMALGLVVARRRHRWTEASWDDETGGFFAPRRQEPRWSTEIIWVARAHRGTGYGRLLINLALLHLETQVQEMAWSTPFTEAGERLARSFTGQTFYAA
jgi:GNAT superfamily N-acetyltransferase